MSFPQFGYSYSASSQIFVSATSSATCCTSGSRAASDVSSGSSQTATLGCSAYENRLLAGSRTELNAALGLYGSPYAAAGANPGYANYLPYNADPAGFYTALNSQYDLKDSSPALHAGIAQPPPPAAYYSYDPSFGQYDRYGAVDFSNSSRRKNATRETTSTLKAWLYEHRKNPYPTKGEKIMLAIITKMTLTQVSTWFANARRRLKKENKMTWTPRNRSEDEEEEENIDLEKNDDEDTAKLEDKGDPEAAQLDPADPKGDGGAKEADGASSDSDCKESPEQTLRKEAAAASPPLVHCGPAGRLLLQAHHHHQHHHHPPQLRHPGAEDPPYRPPSTDLHPGLPPSHGTSVIHTPQAPAQPTGPGPLSKPKLWSLAEIATSADKVKEAGGGETPPQTPSGLSGAAAQSPAALSPSATPCPFPSGAASVLPRPLYYATSPFYPGYTNYASFGHLHGNAAPAGAPSPHFNGLNQTLLNRAESLTKDAKLLRSQSQYDLSKESPYELKKGTSHI